MASFRSFSGWFLSVGVFAALPVIADPNDPNLTEALQLEAQGRYVDAIRLLTPCLRDSVALSSKDQEMCLYVGERIANLALQKLAKTEPNENKRMSFFKELGVELKSSHYGGPYYYHDFFRVMAKKFPGSRYSEEFDYVLIFRESNGVADWESQLTQLDGYLKNHPRGSYAKSAKFELGCIYAGLWTLMRPGTNEAGYRDWANLSEDKDRAMEYRRKAIKMYESGLSHPAKGSFGVSQYDIDDAEESIKSLKNKADAGIGCIISD